MSKGHSPLPHATATFAGGCFWGMEKWYKKEFGSALLTTAVGYIGGTADTATYSAVCTGKTDHAEALQVTFDPSLVSYRQLCEFFFRIHDPTTLHRQANDVGRHYRSAIFVHTPEQEKIAKEVLNEMNRSRYAGKIVTTVDLVPVEQFFKGEPKHQAYLDKNPYGYCSHRPRW